MTYFQGLGALATILRYKSGLILFSGPVSSGKTSTMYALLRGRMQEKTLQVITMEDPVEYHEPMFYRRRLTRRLELVHELPLRVACVITLIFYSSVKFEMK